MEKLTHFLKAIDYKITEGSEFCWSCYGPNARYLDSHKPNVATASCIFDAVTQEVYEVSVTQESGEYKGYRWCNPAYAAKYKAEAIERGFGEDADYYVTDSLDDIFDKTVAMLNGLHYDPRVVMEFSDFDDDLFLAVAKRAHARDITFNQMIEEALRAVMKADGVAIGDE